MITLRTNALIRLPANRKGAAAVECALVAPLLVLITMGAIDVGQFVNVAQFVNDASYEGARRASSNTVTNESEVKAAVLSYFSDQFPRASAGELDSALTVNVRDSSNAAISNGDLTTIPSGSPVSVQVIFQYNTIRWLSGFTGLNDRSLQTTTVMRRE
ncbi:MAG: TadE/TadG family type IV pilus assembly protein [Planctomycetota bacterium]